jgi:hypothetical protein
LKEDPIVQEAIRDFMNLFSMTSQNIVTRDVYFKVFIKIGQILRPNTEAEELQKLIKEDYDRDNGESQFIHPLFDISKSNLTFSKQPTGHH